jgi:hypothetical protein
MCTFVSVRSAQRVGWATCDELALCDFSNRAVWSNYAVSASQRPNFWLKSGEDEAGEVDRNRPGPEHADEAS